MKESRRTRTILGAAALTAGLAAGSCTTDAPETTQRDMPKLTYPTTERGAQVDDYFGTEVADPYRWLEAIDGEPVRAWVTSQNEVSRPFLDALATRGAIEKRLTELWNYERRGVPTKRGDRYFWYHNDGLQNQDVLLVADAVDGAPRVLIDPNGWSEDGKSALAGLDVSHDGRLAAYARSEGGTDWRDWRVLDVETGKDLADHITFTKFTPVSWKPDGSGFFYSRHPLGPDGRGDGMKQVSVWYHELGTDQQADREIFAVPDHPERNPYAEVTDDGRWLVISIAEGYLENAVWLLDLTRPDARPRPLIDTWDARYDFVHNEGDTFYFNTTSNAPRRRLIAVAATAAAPLELQEVIPETDAVLESVSPAGGHFIVQYLNKASSRVEIWHPSGRRASQLELPTIGNAEGFSHAWKEPETFFAFESYTQPRTIYRVAVPGGEIEPIYQPALPADLSGYETRQVFFASKDQTQVPMFVVHRKGIELDGSHPVLLYGYGGFDVSLTPSFSVGRLAWLEMGGIYAVANLRGGGEFGEDWHLGGARLNKQNVFDDFIAAAEWLQANGYTTPGKTAIEGGSNGGLLVGAVMTQRPELFGVAIADVGVLDMLRYHLPSLNARQWADDYGLSEIEEDFRAQIAYSPLHNLKTGTCYPPTLITTADHDDRVVPWHSYKFAAALQSAQSCAHPTLLAVETRVGHGAGTPTSQLIEKLSDRYAFISWALGMENAGRVGGGPTG